MRARSSARLARDFGKLLDDLDDRPIRDAVAVGQAPAADDECVAERAEELGREA
jgi:hypothetical protein